MTIPTLNEVIRGHIAWTLKQTGWKISGPHGAANLLGVKRTTLQAKMKKLGIVRKTDKSGAPNAAQDPRTSEVEKQSIPA